MSTVQSVLVWAAMLLSIFVPWSIGAYVLVVGGLDRLIDRMERRAMERLIRRHGGIDSIEYVLASPSSGPESENET